MLIDPKLILDQIYCSVIDFALLTLDLEGRITSWNRGAEEIFGFTESEILAAPAGRLFTPEDLAAGHPAAEMRCALSDGRAADFRWHLRKDGSRFWADGVMTPIVGDAGVPIGFMKILRDVTAGKLAHEQVEKLAAIDLLTGVSNRISFDTRLAEMLTVAERSHQLLNLFAIDLDRFKEVNDQFGHGAGDALLRQAAQRIRHAIREGDVVARIGGDEFALLQLNPPSATCAATLAEKILDALATSFDIDGHDVQVSGSIGIAVYPDDAKTSHDLRIKADLALYQAKKSGRNCFHYFTDALDDAVRQRNLDKIALRQMVADSGFQLEFQPIVRAKTGVTISMEALIRFPCARLSARAVDYTIELAREIGVIATIGAWVFRQSCMQLREWRKRGIGGIRIAINTCAKELMEPGYIQNMLDTLGEFGLDSATIEIELTERDAIELNSANPAILSELHNKGFLLALDDFGTGYSSLSYLRGLPIDMIKLDRSFVQDTPVKADANQVVTAVISLAHALRLEVTAEGVENQAQADFLERSHCQSLQGYLFSRSMPGKAATQWLSRFNPYHAVK